MSVQEAGHISLFLKTMTKLEFRDGYDFRTAEPSSYAEFRLSCSICNHPHVVPANFMEEISFKDRSSGRGNLNRMGHTQSLDVPARPHIWNDQTTSKALP